MLAVVRLLTVLVVVGFAVFVAHDRLAHHPEDAPWTPLDLTAPIGWATGAKLAALRDRPTECRALLAAAGVTVVPVPSRADGPGCSTSGAVRIEHGSLLRRGLVLSCPLAAALTVWQRQVVEPTARAAGERATAIADFGSYNCRRIAGSDRLSEHATANAVDIGSVRFGHGDVVVARDWRRRDARGASAHALRDGACRLFAVTLSPDYNGAHRDHLHLDMGRGWLCG